MNNRLLYIGLGSVFVVMIGLYFIQFGFYPLSDSPQNWGAFGDFLGGILNPIISFTALIILIKTIKQNEKALVQAQIALHQNEKALQQNATEMIESRKELAISAQSQSDIAKFEKMKFEENINKEKLEQYKNNIDLKNHALSQYLNDGYVRRMDSEARIPIFELITQMKSTGSYTVNITDHSHTVLKDFLNIIHSLHLLVISIKPNEYSRKNDKFEEVRINKSIEVKPNIDRTIFALENVLLWNDAKTSKLSGKHQNFDILIKDIKENMKEIYGFQFNHHPTLTNSDYPY